MNNNLNDHIKKSLNDSKKLSEENEKEIANVLNMIENLEDEEAKKFFSDSLSKLSAKDITSDEIISFAKQSKKYIYNVS